MDANRIGIDDLLADAQVLEGEYVGYDHTAAQSLITARLSDALARGVESWDCQRAAVQGTLGRALSGVPAAHPAYATLHEQARQDLTRLSALVVNDPEVSTWVALLEENSPRVDPQGALAFACLLELTGRWESAQFWWQFAAGAGNHTAAYCLYLHHMKHGEVHTAGHWFDQAALLIDQPLDLEPAAPVQSRLRGDFLQTGIFIEYITSPEPEDPTGAPEEELEAAVKRLPNTCDEDFGTIARPDRYLVNDLEAVLP